MKKERIQPAGDTASTEASQVAALNSTDTVGDDVVSDAPNGTGTEASLVGDVTTGRNMCIRCRMYEFCVEEFGVTSECLSCEDFHRASD